MIRHSAYAAAAALAALAGQADAQSRDQIRIVGSSTVFPYTQAVAERFATTTDFPSPVVESTGTGGGMQIFCRGIGEAHPDITGASRAMKPSEYQLCAKNGVDDVTEALIGYDGLSIAVSEQSEHDWALSMEQVYQALAAKVPVDGEWVDNPHQNWSDIDSSLPDAPITVYGPPPTSGTRDAFVELAMNVGCSRLDYVEEQGHDGDWIEENCSRMRQDGPFIEAGENDNLIVQRLTSDPQALGIFGYSFLFENQDRLNPVSIDGVDPSEDTIADNSYPISRPLFFYVKNAHRGVIPGMNEFISEYMSEDALASGGYLSERGLVALNDERRKELQDKVMNAKSMSAPAEG